LWGSQIERGQGNRKMEEKTKPEKLNPGLFREQYSVFLTSKLFRIIVNEVITKIIRR